MTDLKPGWRRVKFGDVVRHVKNKVDPETSGLERFVAGDHMDTDDLRIRRWGTIGDGYLGPAFNMRFRPGQVLYGSRRTYLRKVAVADFEGVCANTTFVLESANPRILIPGLLPFVMQTEQFHEHSRRESKGSVNPYVNFSDIAWYEFALPSIEEQNRLVNILAATTLQSNSCKVAIECLAELEKSAIIDTLLLRGFSPHSGHCSALPAGWGVYRGDSIIIAESGNGEPICSENGDALFLKVADFNRNGDERNILVSESSFNSGNNKRVKIFDPGAVVFPKRGASIFLNKVGLISLPSALDPNLMSIRPRDNTTTPEYLYWLSKGIGLWRLAETTSVPQLNHKHLYSAFMLVPPKAEQIRVCNDLNQLRDSMNSLCARYSHSVSITRQLLREAGI